MKKMALGITTLCVSLMHAAALDSKRVFELLKKGSTISAVEASELEKKLRAKPNDASGRIQLLSYYTARPAGVVPDTIKAARVRHVLAIIESDPRDGFGLFRVATGIHRIHCQGDELADPEGAQQVGRRWVEQASVNPLEDSIRREAVRAIQYCAPEEAEKLLNTARDSAGLGGLYATAVLGITGLSYSGNEPAGSDPALRQRPFARKALQILEDAADKDLVRAATSTLLSQGAILWADGKLDWDYTALGNSLLAKAKQMAPDDMHLKTLPTDLPRLGERPPLTIRVGGNAQQSRLVQQIAPKYPRLARDLGIQGTVQLTALVGLDGRIVHVQTEGGPPELVASAIDAVRQWAYKPTLLNGRPCYVVTRIDINYTLSPR